MTLEAPPSRDAQGEDDKCPFTEDCANASTWRCKLCRQIASLTPDLKHYPAFKDKEYYRKTLPFIEVKWLFEKLQGA